MEEIGVVVDPVCPNCKGSLCAEDYGGYIDGEMWLPSKFYSHGLYECGGCKQGVYPVEREVKT